LYYYKHDKAVELEELLIAKSSQVGFILANVGKLLKSVQFDLEKSHKCKTELAE
jgi:hypothetical protein